MECDHDGDVVSVPARSRSCGHACFASSFHIIVSRAMKSKKLCAHTLIFLCNIFFELLIPLRKRGCPVPWTRLYRTGVDLEKLFVLYGSTNKRLQFG